MSRPPEADATTLAVETIGELHCVVDACTRATIAGPFALRETAEWNARMQVHRWLASPTEGLWFARDEVGTLWMATGTEGRIDYTAITLATIDRLSRFHADLGTVSAWITETFGRPLPRNAMGAGWVYCPAIGWYVRAKETGELHTAPAEADPEHPIAPEEVPLDPVSGWDPRIRVALEGWVFVTFGVVLDPESATCNTWPVTEHDARAAAARVLSGQVGARIPEREDTEVQQYVFAYLPAPDVTERHQEVGDAIVVEPTESGDHRSVDVCVGVGMNQERITASIDGGPPIATELTLDVRGLDFSTITGTGHVRLRVSRYPGETATDALARTLRARVRPANHVREGGSGPQHAD